MVVIIGGPQKKQRKGERRREYSGFYNLLNPEKRRMTGAGERESRRAQAIRTEQLGRGGKREGAKRSGGQKSHRHQKKSTGGGRKKDQTKASCSSFSASGHPAASTSRRTGKGGRQQGERILDPIVASNGNCVRARRDPLPEKPDPKPSAIPKARREKGGGCTDKRGLI